MELLNVISVILWVFVAGHSLTTLYKLRGGEFNRKEVKSIVILLLSGLNISRGIISIFIDLPQFNNGYLLMEYFNIGISLFQLLLCNFVLRHIDREIKTTVTITKE